MGARGRGGALGGELPAWARSGYRISGRYAIEGVLGQGGMGVVLEARTREGDRVAVKLLSRAASGPARERLAREAALGRRLRHPNLVRVLDQGEEAGVPYVVMELLRGESLEEELRRRSGPWPPAEVEALLRPVAAALDHLHEAGLVHRDLKPANVQLEAGGRVVLMDLGLVRDPDRTALTRTGTTLGTPLYMAPEQVRAEDATAATDVFALGLLAHRLLRGTHAFPVPAPMDLARYLAAVVDGARVPDPGDGLEPEFRRALAVDPRERPGSATGFIDELASALLDRSEREEATTADLGELVEVEGVGPDAPGASRAPSRVRTGAHPGRGAGGAHARALMGVGAALIAAGAWWLSSAPRPELVWWASGRLGPVTVARLQVEGSGELTRGDGVPLVPVHGSPGTWVAVPSPGEETVVVRSGGDVVAEVRPDDGSAVPVAWVPPFEGEAVGLRVGEARVEVDRAGWERLLEGGAPAAPEVAVASLFEEVSRLDLLARTRASWEDPAVLDGLRGELRERRLGERLETLGPWLRRLLGRPGPARYAALAPLSTLRWLETFLLRRGVSPPYDLVELGIEELLAPVDFYPGKPVDGPGRVVFPRDRDLFELDVPRDERVLSPGGFFTRPFPPTRLPPAAGEGAFVWLRVYWTRANLDSPFYFGVLTLDGEGPYFLLESARTDPEAEAAERGESSRYFRRVHSLPVPLARVREGATLELRLLPWLHPTGRPADYAILQAVDLVRSEGAEGPGRVPPARPEDP